MRKSRMSILSFIFISLGLLTVDAQEEVKKESFKPTVKINGRIQYDFEFLKRAESDDWYNGNEFRRVHLSAAGKVAKNVKYKVETSFAHGDIGFRDVYLKYTAGKYGNFAFGSMAEPTGLNMATSSKYISFFERGMITSLQNFRWGAGFHYENYKLFDGKASFQLAYTNNGSNGDGFKDSSLEEGMNFVVRATGTVINDKEKRQVVHLGVNYDNRPQSDLKFRPENHMGGKYTYTLDDANGRSSLGFELGTTFGPISVQGEYKTQTMDSDTQDYNMTSYYAFASYFLTGEHRPYKHASFGRVKPKNDIDNGGLGAIELLVRYSNMSASDDIVAANVGQPESINNISIGANWYLNSHARFMYNYVLTDDGNESLGNLTGHLFRFQLDF
jgi:phosphate-selective porin OprO/OprP